MKRLFLSVVLAASFIVAPLAHADTGYVPIGDPYTDTIQLWSDLASALSSLANDFAVLFDGHQFAARSMGGSQEQPASAATAAASFASEAQTAHPATSSPPPSQPGGATPTVINYITNPIESVVEKEPLASNTFVTQNELAEVLLSLSEKLAPAQTEVLPQEVAADGNPDVPYAASNNIGTLSGVTISNATISGGSLPSSSLTGTITNAIDTGAGEIDSLNGTGLTYSAATTTNATSTNLFASNLTAGTLSVSGTSTLKNIVLSSLNCSTFGNGGKLTTDAIGNVTCAADQGGSGSTIGGSDTQVQFNSGGSFQGSSSFTFASSTNLLTVTNASTTNFSASYASSTNFVAGSATSTNLFAALANVTTGFINTLSGSQLTYTAASTTNLSASGEGYFATASTTNLTVSGSPSGFLQTNAQGIVSATSTFSAGSIFGTFPVANGGTGSTTLTGILKGNGTGAIQTAVGGTDYEFPLTFSTGLNRTGNTITNTGVLSLGSGYATTTGTSITLSTTTQSFNGLTIAQQITSPNDSDLLFTPAITGTLSNAGLAHSTITLNGATITLGDTDDTITAASSTLLGDTNTFSGNDTFRLINLSATSSSLLGVNASGEVVATTSIGTNLLTGVLGTINGASFSVGGSITLGSASTTLLGDNNTFSGGNLFTASTTVGNGNQNGGLTVSGGATTTGNLIVQGSGTSTFLGNVGISGNIIPATDNTYTLGSPSYEWKSVYIGPGSLFVNGQEVVHTDPSQNVVLTANSNQNFETQTSGSGSILLNSSGTGNIQLAGPVQITGGDAFTTSNGTAVVFTNGVEPGNLELSGNAIQATNTNGGISFSPNGNGSTYFTNGNVGIGTTNPLSKLEVEGAVAAQNFSATSTTATSTFADGVNLTGGCFAVNGTCIGASSASTTLLGDNNAFSGVDNFTNASSNFAGTWQTLSPSHFQTAGTYLTGIGNYATTTSTSISVSTSTQTFNGLTFGNSFVVSASGITVTPTVSGTILNSGLANSTIGATSPNGTLSFGSAASLGSTFTADVNFAHPNSWTGLQQFQNASTTIFSAYGPAYFGATATSTFSTNGALNLAGLGTFTNGFVSQASSTVVGNFTTTGTNAFSGASNFTGLGTWANGFLSQASSTVVGNLTLTGTLSAQGATFAGTTGTTTIASGQGFTVGGSQFVVQQGSGNVGIGTTTPANLLDIESNASIAAMSVTDATNNSGVGIQSRSGYGLLEGLTGSGSPGTLVLNAFGGNVGIGTTSPSYALDIGGFSDIRAADSALFGAWPAGNSPSLYAFFGNSQLNQAATGNYALLQDSIGDTYLNAAGGKTITFSINNSTDMTLASNGNVGIGTTSPQQALEVKGASDLENLSGQALSVNEYGSKSDNVSASIGYIPGTNYGLEFDPSSDTNSFPIIFANAAHSIAGSVNESGSATTYNTTSDRRLKENIASTTVGLSALMQIPVDNFDFISDPTHTTQQGFIAQSLYPIYPEAVTTNGDNGIVPLGPTSTPWEVDYGRITPLIVSAVQDIANISSTFEQNLIAWLGNAQNGIVNLFAANGHFSNEVCIGKSGGGEACVTGDQLTALLSAASLSASTVSVTSTADSNPSPGSSESATSTVPNSSPDTGATDTPPNIQINGDNPAIIQVGVTYNDLGATITGPTADLNLGIQTIVNGAPMSPVQIDTSQGATDTIDYVATDQNGLTSTSTRTLIIEPADAPSIVPTDDASSTDATTTTATSTAP